jgi:hypothetical protein
VMITEQSAGAPEGVTEVAGSASVHLQIAGQSWVEIASHTELAPVAFDVFVMMRNFSVLDMAGATFAGGPVKGKKYLSRGINDLTLPKNGIPGDQPGEAFRSGVLE